MKQKIVAVALAALMTAMPLLSFADTEVRLIGGPGENNAGDMYLGASGYFDSAGGRRVYAINLNTFGFPQDNAIKGGNANLYGLSLGVVPAWRVPYFGTSGALGTVALGTAGYCLKSTGTTSAPTWGACSSTSGSGTDNADEIVSGTLGMLYGGWGEDISTATGVPYLDNGSLSWDTLVQFIARMGITYNPTDNSWTFAGKITSGGEIVAPSFATTAEDGYRRVNAANTTAPTDNVVDGDCYYDNSAASKTWLCYNGTAWVEPTVHTKDFVIYGYSASHDNVVRWKADSAQTLTQLDCITGGADNVTVTLYECDGNAANCSTTGLVSAATSSNVADTSASNGGIDAGDWIKASLSTLQGTASSVACTVRYLVTRQ